MTSTNPYEGTEVFSSDDEACIFTLVITRTPHSIHVFNDIRIDLFVTRVWEPY
jgi:hypothetical protein